MNYMWKRKLFFISLFIVLGCTPKMGEDDVVTIDRKIFNRDEFFGDVVEPLFSKLSIDRRRKVVDEFARRKIIQKEASKRGIDKEPDVLRQQNQVEENIIINTIIEEEVWAPLLTDSALKVLYDKLGQERSVHNIVLTYKDSKFSKSDRSKEEAYFLMKEIREKIVKGEIKFFEAAKKYSEDASRFSDGFLGMIKWGILPEPIQSVAFSLKLGEISQPFESDIGIHILRVAGIKEVPQKPFNEKKGELRQFMRSGKGHEIELALKKFEKKLRDNHQVRFNQDIIEDILNEIKKKPKEDNRPYYTTELVDLDVVGIVCVADGEPYDLEWFQDRIAAMGSLFSKSVIVSERSLKKTLEHILYRYLTLLFARNNRDEVWYQNVEQNIKLQKLKILQKTLVAQLAQEYPDISNEKLLVQALVDKHNIRINENFISSFSSLEDTLKSEVDL